MTTKPILTPLCILMLLAGVMRLAVVDRKEFQLYRFNQRENALVPKSGSFAGIGAKGDKEEANIYGKSHLLVFVIHRKHIASDVKFWNSVIRSVSLNRKVPAASVQYWGICDAAAQCNPYQADANFRILGYIDPLEMHIVADTDARNEALLYGQYNMLKARVARIPEPSIEVELVARELKSK